MNQNYRVGDQVLVTKVGTVVAVEWDEIFKCAQYKLRFEDGKVTLGYAIVSDAILMQPNEQRLSTEEIKALKEKGVEV